MANAGSCDGVPQHLVSIELALEAGPTLRIPFYWSVPCIPKDLDTLVLPDVVLVRPVEQLWTFLRWNSQHCRTQRPLATETKPLCHSWTTDPSWTLCFWTATLPRCVQVLRSIMNTGIHRTA